MPEYFLVSKGVQGIAVAEYIQFPGFIQPAAGNHTVNPFVNPPVQLFTGKLKPYLQNIKRTQTGFLASK